MRQSVTDRLTVLESFCDGDTILDLIELYLAESERSWADLCQAAEQMDGSSLAHKAHNLKGSSANVGANHLAELCEQIEHKAKMNALHELPPIVKELSHQLFALRRLLQEMKARRKAAQTVTSGTDHS
jgi:HPt (histidine-containing phosphotransfer) domain-containing protein